MMNGNPLHVPLIALLRYLKDKGWSRKEHPNDKLLLFRGPLSDNGAPLEVLIPSNEQYLDYADRVNDVVKILSLIVQKSASDIVREILLTSHDIFKIRILDTGEYSNSISLPFAADALKSLKDLFVYGACSEEQSLPYFEKPLQVGINHAKLCRFGHTFEGSFGLTINSPIIQDYIQMDLFEEQKAIPFERRVLERIIRGLDLLEQSVEEDNGDILVNSYDIALNSKMCESLLELSLSKTSRIGLDVIWSPKFSVSEDIKSKGNWVLTDTYLQVLEYAAEELKKIEPYTETIIGTIVTLHSIKNPMSDEEFLRQATVKHEIDGRTVHVKVDLDKDKYTTAYEAHGKGIPIKAKGTLYRKGNTWRMIDVSDVSLFP